MSEHSSDYVNVKLRWYYFCTNNHWWNCNYVEWSLITLFCGKELTTPYELLVVIGTMGLVFIKSFTTHPLKILVVIYCHLCVSRFILHAHALFHLLQVFLVREHSLASSTIYLASDLSSVLDVALILKIEHFLIVCSSDKKLKNRKKCPQGHIQ